VALYLRGDYECALAEVQRSLTINPNLAPAHGVRGSTLVFSGRPRDGLASLETCIRLDPRDPNLAARLNHVALGLYFCREYEAAIEAAKRTIRSYPKHPLAYRWLAAALGQVGRIDEARVALESAVAVAPASLETYVRQRPLWFRSQDHAHWVEGLRKAGWSEE